MEIKNFLSIEDSILKLVREATETNSNYYVECTRTGRRRLAMKTFYKTRATPEESAAP